MNSWTHCGQIVFSSSVMDYGMLKWSNIYGKSMRQFVVVWDGVVLE